jgi:hypothetical protein
MRPLAESCFANQALPELIILSICLDVADFSLARFSTLCRTVLSAPQRLLSVAERREGRAWRAVTHHATRFSHRVAASPSAASEDAGCAKYECPHVWIGSALARSKSHSDRPPPFRIFLGEYKSHVLDGGPEEARTVNER